MNKEVNSEAERYIDCTILDKDNEIIFDQLVKIGESKGLLVVKINQSNYSDIDFEIIKSDISKILDSFNSDDPTNSIIVPPGIDISYIKF